MTEKIQDKFKEAYHILGDAINNHCVLSAIIQEGSLSDADRETAMRHIDQAAERIESVKRFLSGCSSIERQTQKPKYETLFYPDLIPQMDAYREMSGKSLVFPIGSSLIKGLEERRQSDLLLQRLLRDSANTLHLGRLSDGAQGLAYL